MDWDVHGAKVLHSGSLLKTAGGHKKDRLSARPGTAKVRFFRLVTHEQRKPPEYVLYYHESVLAKAQKGHLVLGAESIIKMGWLDNDEDVPAHLADGGGGAGAGAGAGGGGLPPRRASLRIGGSARKSTGNMAQALAALASKRNAFHIQTNDRILFLMATPETGKDSSVDAQAWVDAINDARIRARDTLINKPTDFMSLANVHFDAASQSFVGVPDQMADDFVKAAFNLPLTHTTFVQVPGYGIPGIPLMLTILREIMLKLRGDLEPGIFRIAPSKDECEHAKRAACLHNRGDLAYVQSPHIFATLIKQWLRDMPGGLLNQCVVCDLCIVWW
jgi:hypothetical protein